MSAINDIRNAVRQLSPDDLAEFRAWFAEYDAELWDRQIEEDAAAGQLDSLVNEAIEDLRNGLTTDLNPDRM